jgi:hypothetical protein
VDEEHEELREITIFLEEEQIEAVDELARNLTKELNQQWDRGAVIRLALSEFFSKKGKII